MNSCHLASHFRSGVGATQARPPVSETLREWSRRVSETDIYDMTLWSSQTKWIFKSIHFLCILPYDCQQLCASNPQCASFTWNYWQPSVCYLMSNVPDENYIGTSEGASSGIKSCWDPSVRKFWSESDHHPNTTHPLPLIQFLSMSVWIRAVTAIDHIPPTHTNNGYPSSQLSDLNNWGH